MKNQRYTLRRIEELHAPRHMFILPDWADPAVLDSLIQNGSLTFSHLQRTKGVISQIMGLQLTPKGVRMLTPGFSWPRLALRGSLAGASFMGMSMAILYLG